MPSRSPQPIREIITELMVRRGYAREQGAAALVEAWRRAVGPDLAGQTAPDRIRRGTLEVVVAHNLLIQELSYRQQELLAALRAALPEQPLVSLRFRVGALP